VGDDVIGLHSHGSDLLTRSPQSNQSSVVSTEHSRAL